MNLPSSRAVVRLAGIAADAVLRFDAAFDSRTRSRLPPLATQRTQTGEWETVAGVP